MSLERLVETWSLTPKSCVLLIMVIINRVFSEDDIDKEFCYITFQQCFEQRWSSPNLNINMAIELDPNEVTSCFVLVYIHIPTSLI